MTLIRGCSDHVCSGRTVIISSGKALYLKLRLTMFAASNGIAFAVSDI